MAAIGPSETSGDVRCCAAVGGQADIRRAPNPSILIYEYTP